MLEQGTPVGTYTVETVLGRGGMGTVFRARHAASGRLVALKVLREDRATDPDLAARLLREGRAQAALDHPHVVPIFDAGESEHGAYLAMGLIDGPRLVDEIRERRVDARRTLVLLAQVADALDAAHAAGLVHRDVKPHNVLVGPDDHAYLADFGLTRLTGATAMTATGVLTGTVAYLAPEVVRGEEAGPAADRYAFAAMAFECLTGTVVFPRPTEAGVLFAHAGDPPPQISTRRPDLGDSLDDLFLRALSKDPDDRPATAGALVADLRRGLGEAGLLDLPAPLPVGGSALRAASTAEAVVPAFPPGALTVPSRRAAKWRASALAAVAGAALVGGAWAVVGGSDEAPMAGVPLPADTPGLTYIGADLGGAPGRPADCRDAVPTPASPGCTAVQAAKPGATLVVPATGVIRDWTVRGARGELTLVVLRQRDGGAFQVSTSSTETTGSADVQRFGSDLPVDRGDLVGLVLRPGAAVGVRNVGGARIDRWLPPLAGLGRPPDAVGDAGVGRELLLRVGIAPGAKPRLPEQVSGSAAASLPAGRERARRSVTLEGRTVQIVLVRLGDAHALDAFTGGRRIARIAVPDMAPSTDLVRFVAAAWAPEQGGVDLYFVERGSARVVQHGYVIGPEGLQLLR